MLSKSRTNSEARKNYQTAYAILRTWQHKERSKLPAEQSNVETWRTIWRRHESVFPAESGHLTEAFFWADHEAGKHAESRKQERAARFAGNRFNWKA